MGILLVECQGILPSARLYVEHTLSKTLAGAGLTTTEMSRLVAGLEKTFTGRAARVSA